MTLASTVLTGVFCIGSARGIGQVQTTSVEKPGAAQESIFLEIQRQKAVQSGLSEKAAMLPIETSLYARDARLSVLSEAVNETGDLDLYEEDLYETPLEIQSDEIDITDPDPIEPVKTKRSTNPSSQSSYQNYSPATEGCLTPRGGVFNGPSGKETYYNLPMGGVVRIMRRLGYSEEDWPYWIREDGAKMLGDYIIVAAELNLRPRGTIVPTSLGDGIVCDTGTFALTNPYQLDLAMDW